MYILFFFSCNTGHVKPLNDSCMNNEKGETAEKCNIIKKENGCFTNCHDVIDPKPFYKVCINFLNRFRQQPV